MTKQQEQSAWLAKHLMGYRQAQREDDKGPWWEKPGGEPVAPVAHWDPDFPAWAPLEIIAQAKEVQEKMRARGWSILIKDNSWSYCACFYRHYGSSRVEGMASDVLEAAAICLAAGRALGWPFEEEA